ncbi:MULTISPECIES: EscV/YscV/HrcV family type III secretion system export apparatus protein [Enterobacterales]|uniref:EscV/YscV/HrcV family type III secretion system export apparatus protein n=1 Tax=Enterobacterales TaxID=91347 RepID=UPI000847D838|nr:MULTISPECIES: EscV/YscV/HrcV family type III secretion system export apparatus protein [Enterobacterales]ODQ08112.1 EscV/YscV/HrcV family type III secretion system export apparatus protein [Shigella sp. FC130]OEI93207.1 EscV/YscV/HrcV family type III secretion system export apparatus protein [Shigella sp. FC1655]WOO49389.1 EscV/YscV/HrcV family type III secretion system export apparatus protein [Hafnia alvei]WPF03855.1 EscV/YscV/HrcV family type III secretion system export apparatus protein 
MIYRFLLAIKNKPELIVLSVMILVIMMLIIPLPTYIVDFLIGLNITISLLIFMSSFYITRILNFMTFPALLLITTLFRLALSISTSRLILLDADAGEIITSFGEFVIGENLVVGFVVFSIVTIVQFLVITKGSERVAEVAARFSLDGMPGKQMSIDADLKSGIINNEEVKIRRKELGQESQLYGSFDGAMKFIKGDAIAGIVIIFVNLIGGISVGMAQMDLSITEALHTYTLLTIGDGLVAQIPALLISISAGFIVTRVGGENSNLGFSIMNELLAQDFALLVTAILAFIIGFLPGFPTPVFLILSVLLGGYFFKKQWKVNKKEVIKDNQKDKSEDRDSDSDSKKGLISNLFSNKNELESENSLLKEDITLSQAETLPLIITVSSKKKIYLSKLVFEKWLKKEFILQYGVLLPDIIIHYSDNIDNDKIIILINEVKADEFDCPFPLIHVKNPNDEFSSLNFKTIEINDNNVKNYWVNKSDKDKIELLGYKLELPEAYFYKRFSNLMTFNIVEFLGIQETKNILDKIEENSPELLKECYRQVSIQRINDVLQRLVQEKIPIRNIKTIIGGLVQWGSKEKDPVLLTEHIRSLLSRYISHFFSNDGKINVIILSNNIEEIIRGGIRQSSSGTFLNLEPAELDMIIEKISTAIDEIKYIQDYLFLTAIDIRRFVKKLIETQYPQLSVLSYDEVTSDIEINVLQSI